MARKNLLSSVLGDDGDNPSSEKRSTYALKGASGKMKASLDTLADNSKKLLEGQTVVEIDTRLIDVSFINDRLSGDDEEYNALRETIRSGGQDSPVLLRPHPEQANRYMIVFGHRRVRVARDLERPVRAVIREMDDVAHILAQGQENSARSDLSFIEKALFAKKLLELGHGKEIVQAALTIDATLLSRMLSVSQKVSSEIIEAIGPAKSVGRDRWEAFKKLALLPPNKKKLLVRLQESDFVALESEARFEDLMALVQTSKTKPRSNKVSKQTWTPPEGTIKGSFGKSGKGFQLALTSADAAEFGAFIAGRLDELYSEFNRSHKEKTK